MARGKRDHYLQDSFHCHIRIQVRLEKKFREPCLGIALDILTDLPQRSPQRSSVFPLR